MGYNCPMAKQNKLTLKYLALITWLIVIFLFSNQVARSSSVLSGSVVDTLKPYLPGISEGLLTFMTRKSAHIGLYFVLGLLTYSVAIEYRLRAKQQVWYSWAFVVAYASIDEIHQLFRAGRSGEPRDVLIDAVAGLAGIGVYWVIKTKRGASSSS